MSSFVDPVKDGWMGKELAEYLFGQVRHPQNDAEWLSFFTHLVRLYDAVNDPDSDDSPKVVDHPTAGQYEMVPTTTPVLSKTITPEVRSFIVHQVRANVPSPDIRMMLVEHFGVEVSASHMSHLRRRVLNNIKEQKQ